MNLIIERPDGITLRVQVRMSILTVGHSRQLKQPG